MRSLVERLVDAGEGGLEVLGGLDQVALDALLLRLDERELGDGDLPVASEKPRGGRGRRKGEEVKGWKAWKGGERLSRSVEVPEEEQQRR